MNTPHTVGHVGWSPDYKSTPMLPATGKLMPVVQRRLVRPLWMTGGEANDWIEDAEHENGQYFNRCLSCNDDFIGHKRRHQCRKCHYEAKARYDAMTPDERAAQDAFIAGEIAEFYRTNDKPIRGATTPEP